MAILIEPPQNELSALQSLSDSAGFLKKMGDGKYFIDNNNYLPLSGGTVTGAATFSNFTSLGGVSGGHPAIKLIRFSGVTGASQGDITNIVHNLTISKIIGVLVFLKIDPAYFIPPGFTEVAGYLYTWSIYYTNFNLRLSRSSSASILSKQFEVCIVYMQ